MASHGFRHGSAIRQGQIRTGVYGPNENRTTLYHCSQVPLQVGDSRSTFEVFHQGRMTDRKFVE